MDPPLQELASENPLRRKLRSLHDLPLPRSRRYSDRYTTEHDDHQNFSAERCRRQTVPERVRYIYTDPWIQDRKRDCRGKHSNSHARVKPFPGDLVLVCWIVDFSAMHQAVMRTEGVLDVLIWTVFPYLKTCKHVCRTSRKLSRSSAAALHQARVGIQPTIYMKPPHRSLRICLSDEHTC